jgi:hypothetical protein
MFFLSFLNRYRFLLTFSTVKILPFLPQQLQVLPYLQKQVHVLPFLPQQVQVPPHLFNR